MKLTLILQVTTVFRFAQSFTLPLAKSTHHVAESYMASYGLLSVAKPLHSSRGRELGEACCFCFPIQIKATAHMFHQSVTGRSPSRGTQSNWGVFQRP